ncbi:MAG: pilin N-terminal domain-containing protein [Peptoniphilus harei]|nr:pilin N-terminal domain-containing protein [Peptoniphilus harei]
MNKKKIMSLIMALVMLVGVFSPLTALAAEEKTNTVTLHKILQTEKNLNAKDKAGKNIFPGTKGINGDVYKGNQITDIAGYFGTDSKPIAGVYFAVKNSKGKYIDKSGKELTIQDPKIKGFKDQPNILGGETTEKGLTLDVSGITQEKTEYTIEEIVELSTYKGADGELLAGKKAVPVKITLPLVNEDGVIKEAHVYPKNTEERPSIDKNFKSGHGLTEIEDKNKNKDAGADYKNYEKEKATVTAELGKEVPYEVKTKVEAGSRYQTLNWKDTMSNGLTFDSKKGVKIEAYTVLKEGATGQSETIALTAETDYKLTADDRGFTLSLTQEGLKKVNAKTHPETGEGVAVEFKLTYSATVNKNAVHDIPEKNDIKLEYSNNPKTEKEPTPVTPQNGELKVTKTWDGKGDNEDAEVVYTISNGTTKAAVMLNGKETKGTKYDLGNGITFEVTGAYAGTFKGEALKTGTWNITERVAGYNETIVGTTAGTAAITNKKDTDNPTPLNPSEPKVVNYGKRFVKADAITGERLQGAEFVVKNSAGKFLALKDLDTSKGEGKKLDDAKKAYDNAIKAWNDAVKANPDKKDAEIEVTIGTEKITGKTNVEAKIKELQDAYETAFKAAKNAYTWVDSETAANVVKLVSNEKGMFEITGLEKGTYNLVEITPPQGYAKMTNDQEFIVGPKTYDEHKDGVTYDSDKTVKDDKGAQAQRVDNKKVSIPQTGGMGTVLFTVVGISLMAGAVIAMKKNREEA